MRPGLRRRPLVGCLRWPHALCRIGLVDRAGRWRHGRLGPGRRPRAWAWRYGRAGWWSGSSRRYRGPGPGRRIGAAGGRYRRPWAGGWWSGATHRWHGRLRPGRGKRVPAALRSDVPRGCRSGRRRRPWRLHGRVTAFPRMGAGVRGRADGPLRRWGALYQRPGAGDRWVHPPQLRRGLAPGVGVLPGDISVEPVVLLGAHFGVPGR